MSIDTHKKESDVGLVVILNASRIHKKTKEVHFSWFQGETHFAFPQHILLFQVLGMLHMRRHDPPTLPSHMLLLCDGVYASTTFKADCRIAL